MLVHETLTNEEVVSLVETGKMPVNEEVKNEVKEEQVIVEAKKEDSNESCSLEEPKEENENN